MKLEVMRAVIFAATRQVRDPELIKADQAGEIRDAFLSLFDSELHLPNVEMNRAVDLLSDFRIFAQSIINSKEIIK